MVYRKCNQYAWRRRLPALERQYEDSWINVAFKMMVYETGMRFATDNEVDSYAEEMARQYDAAVRAIASGMQRAYEALQSES